MHIIINYIGKTIVIKPMKGIISNKIYTIKLIKRLNYFIYTDLIYWSEYCKDFI